MISESSGWQGNPVSVKYRARLVSSSILRAEMDGFKHVTVNFEEMIKTREWYRASGKMVCDMCGIQYRDHPHFPYSYAEDSYNGDKELCNGDIIHT